MGHLLQCRHLVYHGECETAMFSLVLFSELDFVHNYVCSTNSGSLVSDRSAFEYTVYLSFRMKQIQSKPFCYCYESLM